MKHKHQKTIAILLTVAMLFSMMPVSTWAAMDSTVPQTQADGLQMQAENDSTTYNLWVGGEQFTSDKLTINGTTGSAIYNPDTNTLTLNGYTLTAGHESHAEEGFTAAIYYSGSESLNLKLEGINSVIITGNRFAVWNVCGIYSSADIYISGTGSLTATGNVTENSGEIPSNYVWGVFVAGSMYVSDKASLKGIGNGNVSTGVYADKGITVSGGSLTGEGGSERRYGVQAEDSITIKGGHVRAQGGAAAIVGSLSCGEGYFRSGSGSDSDGTFALWTENSTASGTYFEFVGKDHATVVCNGAEKQHTVFCKDTDCPLKLADNVKIDNSVSPTISGNTKYHWGTCTCNDTQDVQKEAHKDENSDHKCDVCGLLYAAEDVYVGGKWLQSGKYMDVNGDITDTKPSTGGYVYYHDGVLELHDYTYNGTVQDRYSYYVGENADYSYTAVIFSTNDITIKVYGVNLLPNASAASVKVDGTWHCGDGIASGGNITISGGSDTRNDALVVQGSFGLMTEYGSVETSNLKDLRIIAQRYDGIYSYGDIHIHDNDNVTVMAYRDGIYTLQGDISIQSTPTDYETPKIEIQANASNYYDAGKTYAIFASKDVNQDTPSIRISDKLAIIRPENGKISELKEAMDGDTAYTYVTIHDANDNAAEHVIIKPFTYKVSINEVAFEFPGLPGQSMKDTYGEEGIAYFAELLRPEEGDYIFAGWYTDAAFTTAYDMAQPVYGDITLYGKWIAVNYGSYTPSTSTDAEVTSPNEDVTLTAKAISTSTWNDVKDIVSDNDNLALIGGKDSAVQITAKEDNKPLERFDAPVSITVPVSKNDMKDVADIGSLTLALVTEDETGNTKLTYVGGSYDAENGTFTAYTNMPGNYVLVEKADLMKIVLTIDSTIAQVNDKSVEKDVPSRIVGSRTLVPAAFVLHHMGCGVEWIGDTRTVVVTLPNGEKLFMPVDTPIPGFGTQPIIENGRTLVPVAYVADMMDAYVLWVGDERKVIIVK